MLSWLITFLSLNFIFSLLLSRCTLILLIILHIPELSLRIHSTLHLLIHKIWITHLHWVLTWLSILWVLHIILHHHLIILRVYIWHHLIHAVILLKSWLVNHIPLPVLIIPLLVTHIWSWHRLRLSHTHRIILHRRKLIRYICPHLVLSRVLSWYLDREGRISLHSWYNWCLLDVLFRFWGHCWWLLDVYHSIIAALFLIFLSFVIAILDILLLI